MNLKFVVNDYVLIWNLLFQASISENIHRYKQKLWQSYKKEYNLTYSDYELILKDPKNFIPRDDTIYNLMMDYSGYKDLKKATEEYRVYLVKMWDKYKKQTIKELKDILRIDIKQYQVLVITPKLKCSTVTKPPVSKVNTLTLGSKHKTEIANLMHIVFEIIKRELKDFKKDYQDIVKAVADPLVSNLPTHMPFNSVPLSSNVPLKVKAGCVYQLPF